MAVSAIFCEVFLICFVVEYRTLLDHHLNNDFGTLRRSRRLQYWRGLRSKSWNPSLLHKRAEIAHISVEVQSPLRPSYSGTGYQGSPVLHCVQSLGIRILYSCDIASNVCSAAFERRRTLQESPDLINSLNMSDSVMHAVAGGAGGMIAMVSRGLQLAVSGWLIMDCFHRP